MEELIKQLKEDLEFYKDSSVSDEEKLIDMTRQSNFLLRVNELIKSVEGEQE